MSTASTTELDQTIAALQGGLTSVPPETAVSVISSFEQQAQGLGASELASGLTNLKQLLTSGNASGAEIGQALSQLGSQTSAIASGADPAFADKLQQLGELLSSAGQSLG